MKNHRRSGVFTKLLFSLAVLALALPTFAQPFNGTLDFTETAGARLEVPHDDALNPLHGMTIEAWVYFTPSATEACRSFVGKGYQTSYWFGVCGSTFRTYTGGFGSTRDGGDIPTAEWTHLAMTSDGTTRHHYINGELVATFNEQFPGSAFPTNTDPFMIGNDPDWDFAPDGKMDEVRLWNVARTQADIRRTMRVALDTPATGLVAVWHLDGNGDDVIGSFDGALNAGATFSAPPVGGFCVPSDTQLCLRGGRYAVTVDWETPDTNTGDGKVVPGFAYESGLFWFFNADNWELMIKVLDGCGINGRTWVFTSATTNVQYDVTVRDLFTNATATYHNDQGVSAPAVTDTNAFANCF